MQGKGVSPTSTPSAIPRVGFTTSGHNDLELVGDEWGDRANAALLLLHGGGQNRHAWRGTAGRLAASGYFVTTVDARGHGDSSWSANHKYEMEHLALDVLHLLDRFDRQIGRASCRE